MALPMDQGAWAQTVPLTDQYGCFAQTGDGGDLLPDGQPAPVIAAGAIPWGSPEPCGLQWIADNPQGYTPDPPPSVVHFTRSFRIAKNLAAQGTFVLRYKADDKVEFFLNDRSVAVASCVPPPGDDGECQKYCHELIIPAADFLPDPQVNQLRVDLTNLFNVPVNGKHGYTSLSYSLCVQSSAAGVTVTQSPKPRAGQDFFGIILKNHYLIWMLGFLGFQILYFILRLLTRGPRNWS